MLSNLFHDLLDKNVFYEIFLRVGSFSIRHIHLNDTHFVSIIQIVISNLLDYRISIVIIWIVFLIKVQNFAKKEDIVKSFINNKLLHF